MNVRTKTTLIILVTLVIGIVIGAVGQGALAWYRFDGPPGPPTADRVRLLLNRTIDPDPDQVEALDEILDRYSERIIDLTSQHATQIQGLADSLMAEIDPILTDKQRAQLQMKLDRLKRFHQDMRRGRDGRGPGPRGPWPPGGGRPGGGGPPDGGGGPPGGGDVPPAGGGSPDGGDR